MTARDSFPMVSDPEQLNEMEWNVLGAVYDPQDNDSSFNITRAFEEQNKVILDGKALQAFKMQIEQRFTAK